MFYGPALVASQWVEIDCGYRKGITGRYLSIQLLDRSIPAGGGKLEIREVQIEGWARSCGKKYLAPSPDISCIAHLLQARRVCRPALPLQRISEAGWVAGL